jgi:hypothetical protein
MPYVIDFTPKGVLTIGFSMEMVPPRNFTELTDAKVAVKTVPLVRTPRRLEDVVLIDEDGNEYDRAKILDAILVELVSDVEPDRSIPVKVDVLEFNTDFFRLQLDYSDPDLIFAEDHFNQVKVTFYGTDFFKAKETEETIRFGTTLTWEIFRQIDEKEASKIDTV